MNIYAAFSLFSLIILLYWVISELFTILFRFTGLPEEKARFQVISLLTGCGFTTRESEMIISTRARRRLARITMLFGYVFNITIVSTFINLFLSLKLTQIEHYYFVILIPLGVLAVIFTFMRVPSVRAWGDRLLKAVVGKILKQESENTVLLLDYIGQDSIALVTLAAVPEALRDVPLSQSGLKTELGILVMLVEQPGQKAEPAAADTVFQDGCKLTVFGNFTEICRVFAAREQFADS